MVLNYFTKIFLVLCCIAGVSTLNILFASVGLAGHVTPLLEIAKAMRKHHITFLTTRLAESYVNLNSLASSSFHVIYANDSPNALVDEKKLEQQVFSNMADKSARESLPICLPLLAQPVTLILNKAVELLMKEQFDVIVYGHMVAGVLSLCEKANAVCVAFSPSTMPNPFNFNSPNIFAYTTSNDLTLFSSRIYNAVFTLNMMQVLPKLLPVVYSIFQTLPRVPGPFYDSFSLSNFLFPNVKQLHLIGMPIRFYESSFHTYDTKYLGVLIDDASNDEQESNLSNWLKSKPARSVVYGAFGTSSIISSNRMQSLIHGLVNFLMQTNDTSVLLALRNTNFHTYQAVIHDLDNGELKTILHDTNRFRIEEGFVKQKWILQQASVKIFLTHSGMGSLLESLYFEKPVLCMPFGVEQFANALTIAALNVGESLFDPPSARQALWYPDNVIKYNFSYHSVTRKLLAIWSNDSYERSARIMSLEMKYAGGIKRAVKEIEFYAAIKGDIDRFVPLRNTLPWYQRYMLDLFTVFILIPATIVVHLIRRCCKHSKKLKHD